jgi:hypothetical protein
VLWNQSTLLKGLHHKRPSYRMVWTAISLLFSCAVRRGGGWLGNSSLNFAPFRRFELFLVHPKLECLPRYLRSSPGTCRCTNWKARLAADFAAPKRISNWSREGRLNLFTRNAAAITHIRFALP